MSVTRTRRSCSRTSKHGATTAQWRRADDGGPYSGCAPLVAWARAGPWSRAWWQRPSWSPSSLALYTQAVLQGAFILAKAEDAPQVAAECVDHLRRYVELLFTRPQQKDPVQ